MDNIIELKNTVFAYIGDDDQPVPVLHGISLGIERGSFTAVLGHNGSGKSTMAKLLNGLDKPSEGTVTVNGMDTADESREFDIRRTVGMVFQNPDNQLVASIVEEDVAFGPENLGVPPEEIRKRVDNALKAVGMYEYRGHEPHKLSGGQKQRISIARALMRDPKVIVLDEATSALDSISEREIQKALDNLKSERTTFIVAHRLSTIRNADKIAVISEGKVTEYGTYNELMEAKGEFYELRKLQVE
mgnify:CR=1 FL=1